MRIKQEVRAVRRRGHLVTEYSSKGWVVQCRSGGNIRKTAIVYALPLLYVFARHMFSRNSVADFNLYLSFWLINVKTVFFFFTLS